MYSASDKLPEQEETIKFHPGYRNASLAKKLHDIKCLQKEHAFNQTELSLLEHVTHQRISTFVQELAKKAAASPQRDRLLALFEHLNS